MKHDGIEVIAWLASRENTDVELRKQAMDILDTLCFINQETTKCKDDAK